ncbi:hypothetical protein [Halovivax limisalsi]|uniref:hypothetical protein n=1 Tax=Halovivax limisalsi TaxID=1453760 RepID=UPI001FFCBF6D|nr:hypothetical protein [Halovivax limisalsi]
MSDDVPVTEVFEDVDADPDAVIAAFGADDVDDLLGGPGAHDPEPDPAIDGDVEAASEHLSRLADVGLDPRADDVASPDGVGAESAHLDGPRTTSNGGWTAESGASGPRYTAETVGGGATVDVLPGDGDSFEAFLGLDGGDEPSTTERADHVLVGPGPAAARVSNDSFGPTNASGDDRRDAPARSSTWASEPRPDPAAIDSDAVTDREAELAESVFEWVS